MSNNEQFLNSDWLFEYVVRQNQSIVAVFEAENLTTKYVSDNTEEILGIRREDIINDIFVLLRIGKPTNLDEEYDDHFFEAISMEEYKEAEVLEVTNARDGDKKYFRGSIKRTEIEGTDLYILVWVEKTEEIKRNRQMEEMIDVAKAANESKTTFLANMSHDFRTPMNAITNFNLLIAKNSDNPQKVRDYTHKIGLACQNLLSLLNDVLDMSKIESGKTELTHEKFALGLLLEEVDSVIAFQAKAKHQDYQVHSGGIQQDIFMGDKKRINEILVNILGNAVKYTPVGGCIELNISEDKAGTGDLWDVKFEVKDNGIGMSQSFKDTIFEAFTREKKEATIGIQGTGLGMAITNSLVQMMGGTISVDSEEGKGSVFTIALRLQGVNQDQGDFWSNHGIRRILVIDDDVQECTKIETALHDTDVEVFFSTSGYKALHLIEVSDQDQKGFDVILLGMQIRSLSCFELSRRIKEKSLNPQPILLLLTEDWEDIAEEAREAGIYDFLTKPFFMSTFQQLVEDIVKRSVISEEKKKKFPLEGMRLLAAEDNEINADILEELMKMEKAKIIRAENGEQAVKLFVDAAPGYYDAILMDVQMPVMDGYEAAQKIRKLKREDAAEIPIIAMTANAYADDVQKALASGMNAHVAKPIDIDILETTIVELKENLRST